jgi:hypothetical protein
VLERLDDVGARCAVDREATTSRGTRCEIGGLVGHSTVVVYTDDAAQRSGMEQTVDNDCGSNGEDVIPVRIVGPGWVINTAEGPNVDDLADRLGADFQHVCPDGHANDLRLSIVLFVTLVGGIGAAAVVRRRVSA